MEHQFYNHEVAYCKPINHDYDFVENPNHMFDLMSSIWCLQSCAPSLQANWSKENMTLGQCSITSFLVQDIFGGQVYGVPLPEGGYHCFNCVDGVDFDLTSQQFDHPLTFTHDYPQTRQEHFGECNEKYQRYLYIKAELEKKKSNTSNSGELNDKDLSKASGGANEQNKITINLAIPLTTETIEIKVYVDGQLDHSKTTVLDSNISHKEFTFIGSGTKEIKFKLNSVSYKIYEANFETGIVTLIS